jgi:beta-lactamase class D
MTNGATSIRVAMSAAFLAAASCFADVVDIATSSAVRIEDLEQHIGNRDVIFYAADLETGDRFAYQPDRADERHTPFSTFKIPNLVIALETGVATSLQHERVWNEQLRPAASYWPDAWKQNQTLESAFKRSAVWYFQEVAVEVGGRRYREMLQSFAYGNANAPDADDAFWLDGALTISPEEQVRFLGQLITGELDVSTTTLEALRAVSVLNDSAGYRLHGKTGSGPVIEGGAEFEGIDEFDGDFEGWLVGWVDRPNAAPVVYALYVHGDSYAAIESFRGEMSVRLLRAIGALPDA